MLQNTIENVFELVNSTKKHKIEFFMGCIYQHQCLFIETQQKTIDVVMTTRPNFLGVCVCMCVAGLILRQHYYCYYFEETKNDFDPILSCWQMEGRDRYKFRKGGNGERRSVTG
jgi:hypothetical protein